MNDMASQTWPDVFDPIEAASREFLDGYQEGAIVAMARHAYERAPLIRESWDKAGVAPSDIRSLGDFIAKAPLIDKDDVRAFRDRTGDPAGGMSASIPGETVSIGTTSGTTGDPTPVPNWYRSGSEEAYFRDHWHIGLRPGDYFAWMMFTFRGGHRRRFYPEHGITEICFSISPAEIPRYVEACKRWGPTSGAMFSNPVLLMLEGYFEKTGEDPTEVFKSFKGAIFGGEPLGDRLSRLTRSWGLELYETTSLGDVAGATMCRMHDGFHAYEDLAYIETVDPVTREPLPDGAVGELVVTTLNDRLTPLVRYASGDLVRIKRGRCGCGRNHARYDLLGRATDQIIVNGRSILPREIMGLVEVHDETRAGLFQIVRTGRQMDALRIRVGYDLARLKDEPDALRGRLHGAISAAMDVPLELELVDEQELLKLGPPHKIPRVTNR
jgi:phenylacetate-CoA ligase